MKFSFATLFVVLVSFAVAVDVSKLKEDLAAVAEAIENLDKHAQASSMSYFTALSISFAAQNLVGKIRTSSADIKALDSPILDADAYDIITKLTATDGKVKPLVDDMIKIKPEWDKLGVMFIAAALVDEFQLRSSIWPPSWLRLAPTSRRSVRRSWLIASTLSWTGVPIRTTVMTATLVLRVASVPPAVAAPPAVTRPARVRTRLLRSPLLTPRLTPRLQPLLSSPLTRSLKHVRFPASCVENISFASAHPNEVSTSLCHLSPRTCPGSLSSSFLPTSSQSSTFHLCSLRSLCLTVLLLHSSGLVLNGAEEWWSSIHPSFTVTVPMPFLSVL